MSVPARGSSVPLLCACEKAVIALPRFVGTEILHASLDVNGSGDGAGHRVSTSAVRGLSVDSAYGAGARGMYFRLKRQIDART
jgi:hypothetical protein